MNSIYQKCIWGNCTGSSQYYSPSPNKRAKPPCSTIWLKKFPQGKKNQIGFKILSLGFFFLPIFPLVTRNTHLKFLFKRNLYIVLFFFPKSELLTQAREIREQDRVRNSEYQAMGFSALKIIFYFPFIPRQRI